ncbi:MAG: Uma2 family endonuclease [Methylobacter sp.]|nr:Uma2 family endonuclease [Methylobacter sp.]MDP2427738.1 Uma2 family endonuclease [Methylobacter sp.]MDP3053943.1 Uma2 family endonuclease [Methylobacter sp.]MDP3361674.1 Uma2 family endonuclease [Methylobacter sp.]MDZ4217777.1 Uma2 family endonuclease [Methylobacter sp.]
MLATKSNYLISVEEYLKFELASEVKHEFIDGQVYAMAGASENHDRISGTIYRKFGNHLENSSCEPFTSDMKLKTSTGNFRYPDCMVICDKDDENKFYKTKPVILVEVISRSTRKIDKKDKLLEYINISSLQEYVIIEQDIVDIEVFRRSNHWRNNHYFLGDEIVFESIGLTLSVEEIYHRVQNEDMTEFLNSKTGQ